MHDIIKVKAYHLKQNIDIKKIKGLIDYEPLFSSNTELFYKISADKFFFIINYGAVVFYNLSVEDIIKILKYFEQAQGVQVDDLLVDDFDVVVDSESYIKTEFTRLTVNNVDDDAAKIIMLNLAQSIALNHYDIVSQELLTQMRLTTTNMERKGKLDINKKNILKFIGRTLNTQNKIAENLYIFDAPPITWENEYYNALNTTLSKHFELNSRYKAIENNFKIIETNLEAFLEVNHHGESSKLEWIIIILILVEVIDTFVMKVW
ncbi:RMD1 family protein [Fulvivirga sp. RKSG066]|uniref:RMD1 family protein n=1 Tax=Fulvivirga aurantia TaxID=2529383 RepID=UPI0012BC8759|nr:RMD1 family protein [Fulvivirga aurantia]MTI19959.1 RMD1 family protein [Fulvivirga aurantia]